MSDAPFFAAPRILRRPGYHPESTKGSIRAGYTAVKPTESGSCHNLVAALTQAGCRLHWRWHGSMWTASGPARAHLHGRYRGRDVCTAAAAITMSSRRCFSCAWCASQSCETRCPIADREPISGESWSKQRFVRLCATVLPSASRLKRTRSWRVTEENRIAAKPPSSRETEERGIQIPG